MLFCRRRRRHATHNYFQPTAIFEQKYRALRRFCFMPCPLAPCQEGAWPAHVGGYYLMDKPGALAFAENGGDDDGGSGGGGGGGGDGVGGGDWWWWWWCRWRRWRWRRWRRWWRWSALVYPNEVYPTPAVSDVGSESQPWRGRSAVCRRRQCQCRRRCPCQCRFDAAADTAVTRADVRPTRACGLTDTRRLIDSRRRVRFTRTCHQCLATNV